MFLNKIRDRTLYDCNKYEQVPLVGNKRFLLFSFILIAIIIFLSIRYPGPWMFVERLFQMIGLPIHSQDNGMGLHFANIFLITLLVIAIYFMTRALNRSKFVGFVIIMILITQAPDWLTTMYQRIFTTGVYAVELKQPVNCNYDLRNGKLDGSCHLLLINHSNEQVEITPTITFLEFGRGSEITLPVITLSSVDLPPRAEYSHLGEFNIKTDIRGTSSGGRNGGMSIILSDGLNKREWK